MAIIRATVDDRVEFVLPTGEVISVALAEGRLGCESFRVGVRADKLIAVIPRSGNAIEVSTPVALQREDDAVRAASQKRKL